MKGYIKMTEREWDKKLKIQTDGRDDSHEDEYHYPYEPTPYAVLERLAESGYISQGDRVIDYGCGKGRVGFFLNHELDCHVTGVEFDEKIYQQAIKNISTYSKSRNIRIIRENADEYKVCNEERFYFFIIQMMNICRIL